MRRYVVPGRVELVGKHVDYAGGRSLTCAVDRAITATATPLREAVLRVRDTERQGIVEVPFAANASATQGNASRSSYAVAVARRIARDFPGLHAGVEVQLESDLPASAGLSSSTAVVVALGMAVIDANDLESDPRWRHAVPDAMARAEYFAAIETGAPYADFPGDDGVGVRGGAQDHVAIVCAEADSVGQFSYLPARLERRIPWPRDLMLAVGVSGVRATKTGNARARYNRASDATRALVSAWNAAAGRQDATLAAALASAPEAATQLMDVAREGAAGFSGSHLSTRLEQFREEIEVVVPGVGDALKAHDFGLLGSLVERSQALAEQALENQIAETIFLARSARDVGAVAASAFGAGFGGAVWAMVSSDQATSFLAEWRARYHTAFPSRSGSSEWLLTRPGAPAREV